MPKVTRLLFALTLFLSCTRVISAAPVVAATGVGTTGNTGNVTQALASTPPNGSLVVVIDFSNGTGGAAPTSVKDSNGVALTQVTGAAGAWVYDYVATGSPTASYTCTINAASSCSQLVVLNVVNMSGSGTGVSASGTLSAPSSGALATVVGNLVVCGLNATGGTISATNAGTLTSVYSSGGGVGVSYGIATGTTSTCSGSAGLVTWGVAYATFTIASVLPSNCPPFVFNCVYRSS